MGQIYKNVQSAAWQRHSDKHLGSAECQCPQCLRKRFDSCLRESLAEHGKNL